MITPVPLITFFFSLVLVSVCAIFWQGDVIIESKLGYHTAAVQRCLKVGFCLFLVTEVIFFFGFFWAFFHFSLSPAIQIGGVWPPKGITPFDPWKVPLANTIILLSSGVTVTAAHHAIRAGKKNPSILLLGGTVVYGFLFTCLQAYEYCVAPFSINDGIYGSVFYMLTGLHGFHVIAGSVFLLVGLVRLSLNHFTPQHHLGFLFAAWYWHFVDVVWIFLYMSVYCWGC